MSGSSASYYSASNLALRQAAMARAAVQARQEQLMKKANTAAARLAVAEKAYQDGDLRVASRIYLGLALSRSKVPAADEAKSQLKQLADEARAKLDAISTKLAAGGSVSSPGESSAGDGSGDRETSPQQWMDLVTEAFRQYEQLEEDYEDVPVVNREIRSHVAKQRRRPEIAAVLNEPEAASLLEVARQHEKNNEHCCAYWVHERASKLLPAPSAQIARDRIAEMKQDPAAVAAAKACRDARECHVIYRRAELLIEKRPTRAKELFSEIVRRMPEGSEIHRAALEHVEKL